MMGLYNCMFMCVAEHKIRFQKCVDKMVEHKGVCLDILKFCTVMVNIQALYRATATLCT